MAQSNVSVLKSYATAGDLQAWLNNLATDVNAGRVSTFSISSTPGESGGMIQGQLLLSSSTAIDDLTVAVEDE